MIKKILTNFTYTVAIAIILGIIIGGYPAYTSDISTIALVIAMTLSLKTIDFKKIALRNEIKNISTAFLINYVFLTTVTILLGFLFEENIGKGFIIMASVPPAIAVIPITKILKGNIKISLMSTTALYLTSIFFTPLIIFLFLGREITLWQVSETVLLLIILPLLLSRLVKKIPFDEEKNTMLINICFFVLIVGMVGSNRDFLFQKIPTLAFLSIAIFLRTFGTGTFIRYIGKKIHLKPEKVVPFTLFASFKNEGLAILIAGTLLEKSTVIPMIIAMIFELVYVFFLEKK
ncbi:MAG: hypothetical protein V5A68_01085 [Candidatus Thermoplasmatota archaeon]